MTRKRCQKLASGVQMEKSCCILGQCCCYVKNSAGVARAHSDPAEILRASGRSTRDRSSLPRKALVVAQVAVSAVLLIGAGLLTESLRNLENQNFGFEAHDRMVVRVDPPLAGFKAEQLYGLYQQLQQQLPRIPSVVSAAYSLYSPMRGDNWSDPIHIPGRSSSARRPKDQRRENERAN
jgi:hypothetical protein